MRWKIDIVLFLSSLLSIILLSKAGMNFITIIIVTYIIIFAGYMYWWLKKDSKHQRILNEKCDPELYIQVCEKNMSFSKRPSFQNTCTYSIAVGLSALGRHQESLNMLQCVDLQVKNSRYFKRMYYIALFCCYINIRDMENATHIYENHIIKIRKNVSYPRTIFVVDMAVSEYHYQLNKTLETAKYSLEQLNYLYRAYSQRAGRRHKLHVLYNQAVLMQEIGDINGAIEKYKVVAEKGNKLWISEMSRMKLNELVRHDTI